MSSARNQRLLRRLSGKTLEEAVETILELVPANVRKAKTINGKPTDKWLRGYDSPAKHEQWVHDMLVKLRNSGLKDLSAAAELRALMSAIHRIPNLNAHHHVDMLEALRKAPVSHIKKIREIMDALAGPGGKRDEAIGFIQWLMHKQFGETLSGRLDLDALVKHIPGFGSPVRPDLINAFKKAYSDIAKRQARTTVNGLEFEVFFQKFPDDFKPLFDLNSIKTNFPIFDFIVKDKSGATRFASLADGGFSYLSTKIDKLFRPKDKNISSAAKGIIENVLKEEKAPGLAMLKNINPEKAQQIIAKRSLLLVHPNSVDAIRGVLASRIDFPELLIDFQRITGKPGLTAKDLLEIVQPAFKFD